MAVRSILLRITLAIFTMVARTHCFSIWLERDYVFQGDVFNITCAVDIGAFGTMNLYYPDKLLNAAVTGCQDVTEEFSDYVTGYCASNVTDKSITMQVSGANFSRDDGTFTCKVQTSTTLTLDVRVYSNITTTEFNDTHAFCTTSCGYPVDTSWYENNTEDSLSGHTEDAENCSGEAADTKQRTVTTSIPLDQATSQQLKCCVINTDETDKSACATIDLNPASTATSTQSTEDLTTTTGAALTSTQTNVEASTTTGTQSTEDPTTITGAALNSTQTITEGSTTNTATPDITSSVTTEIPDSDWAAIIDIKSDDIEDPDDDTDYTVFCTTNCNKPAAISIGWYNVKGTVVLRPEDFEDGDTDDPDGCLDLPGHEFRNSTWTVKASDYDGVMCCVRPYDANVNDRCKTISLSKGMVIWIIVVIVLCSCAGCAIIITIIVVVVKKKGCPCPCPASCQK